MTVHLRDIVDPALVAAAIDAGLIDVRPNAEGTLRVLNYSRRAQYQNVWDGATVVCRGLIVDGNGPIDGDTVVHARAFNKFFTVAQHDALAGSGALPPLPGGPFEVLDKVDGCFLNRTALNLWGGGTITIGEVVRNRLPVTLVGMNEKGELVPSRVTGWHNNGTKDNWVDIGVGCNVSRLAGMGATGPTNRLRVTTNHHIYVNGEYSAAAYIQPGDTLMTQDWEPSANVVRLIRASLLGDGCVITSLTRPEQGKYQEGHSMKDAPYAQSLREALGECASQMGDTVSGYGSPITWARSRGYRILGDLRAEWYVDGKKHVPADLSWMDDFAVAKWVMDDGSLSHTEVQQDRLLFATNGFAQDEVERLADRLHAMYGVSTAVFYSKGWVLRVNAGRGQEIERLWAAIAPHVHPSMRRKIPARYRHVPYVPLEAGSERVLSRPVRVLSVTPVEATKQNFHYGRTGFDVTTATHNYMARGVLVHNSLGVGYVADDGRPAIATRGSFTSPQATWATNHLRSHPDLEAGAATILTTGTPCFEIICEASRVVISYPFEDLILLAVTDIATGATRPELEASWPGRVIGRHTDLGAYRDLSALAWADAEGFVIRFADGTLAKTKFAEYLRLHKLITGVSPLLLWENVATGHLRELGVNEASTVSRLGVSDKLVSAVYATTGDPLAAYLDGLPDEYDAWVRTTIAGLWAGFEAAKADAAKLVAAVPAVPRKEQAAWVSAHVAGRWRGIVFAALDGHDVSAQLWRTLRPTETGGPWGALAA